MQIRLIFFATLTLAMFSLRTCNGTTTVAEKPSAGNCSMTFSGAISGTVQCVALGTYQSTTAQSNISIVGNGAAQGAASATIAVAFAGSMGPKTITDANSSQYGATVIGPTVAGQVPMGWAALPNPKQGTLTVTINSASSYATSGGSAAYFVHGTATAYLVPAPNSKATGTVNLTATF